MKINCLDLMNCPYCGTEFSIGDIFERKRDEIVSGYIKCGCSEFPVIEGILNLKIGSLTEYIIRLLKKGEVKKALGISLWKYSEGIFTIVNILPKSLQRILLAYTETVSKYIYRKYLKETSFYNFLGKKTSESNIYLKHRFSAETLWAVYPFLPLLKNRERILDIGCGTGHASFIISNHAKPKEQFCVDYAFRNLYLAKKYFVENAELICLDANYPLPFRSNTFDTIFMLDAFHYVNSRASLAREMERLLLYQGLLLLPHLHNSLSHDPSADGSPLSPRNWVSLFQELPAKALPERSVMENFLLENKLDLLKEYSEDELNTSGAIIIIAIKDRSLFKIYRGLETELLKHKDNLIINPIYSFSHRGQQIVLRRCFPSESFRREFPIAETYLPAEYVIDERINKIMEGRALNLTLATLSEEDLHYVEHLMMKFIILNVPKNYY